MPFEGPKRKKRSQQTEAKATQGIEKTSLESRREAIFERAQKAALISHLFRYGYLEPDHPVQQYIESLAAPLRKVIDRPFRLVLAPDWNETNALACGDGTVVLGRRLLLTAPNESAVQGVIAHEVKHIEGEHSKKRKERDVNTLDDFIATLGQKRVHEYEADLLGSVRWLDEAGINPLGYKLFLRDLHERTRGSGHGITHGSSMDRALNVDLVVQTVDLASIDEPMTPIPADMLAAVKDLRDRKHSNLFIALQPKGYFKELPLKEKQQARRTSIDNLHERELPLALGAVSKYLALKPTDPDYDPDDQRAFEQIFSRIERRLEGVIGERNRPLCAYLCAWFGNVQGESARNITANIERRFSFDAADLDEVFKQLPNAFEAAGFGYVRCDVLKGVQDIFHWLGQKKALAMNKNQQLDIDAVHKQAVKWAPCFVQLDRTFGVIDHKHEITKGGRVRSVPVLLQEPSVVASVGIFVRGQRPKQLKKIERLFGTYRDMYRPNQEEDVYGLPDLPIVNSYRKKVRELFSSFSFGNKEAVQELIKSAQELLGGIGWKYYPNLLSSLQFTWVIRQDVLDEHYAVAAGNDPRHQAAFGSVVLQLLERHPRLSTLSEPRKDMIRFVLMSEYGISAMLRERDDQTKEPSNDDEDDDDVYDDFELEPENKHLKQNLDQALKLLAAFGITELPTLEKMFDTPALVARAFQGLESFEIWSTEEFGSRLPQKSDLLGESSLFYGYNGARELTNALSAVLMRKRLSSQLTFLRAIEKNKSLPADLKSMLPFAYPY